MEKTLAIISIISGILSVFTILAVFIVTNGHKMEFRTKLSELGLKLEGTCHKLNSIGTDISRLKFDNYETLQQKVIGMQGEMSSVSQEVKSLDSAIKNFYAKWAKKLGTLDKDTEKPVQHNTQNDEQLNMLPEGFALTPGNVNNKPQQPTKKLRKFFA